MPNTPPYLAALATPKDGVCESPESENVPRNADDIYATLVDLRARRQPCALCTVVGVRGSSPRKLGAKMIVFPNAQASGTIGGGAIEHAIIKDARAAIVSKIALTSRHNLTKDLGMCCGGTMDIFIEPQVYRPALFLFGAGHVALPLCAIAALSGYDVTVIDSRPEWANAERFPRALEVLCLPPEDVVDTIPATHDTSVIILTHDHALDQRILTKLLDKPFGYLGVIGSHRKREKFKQRLRAEGFTDDVLNTFHSPMGLDIGAELAGEIAVSIVAELIRRRRSTAEGPVYTMMESLAQRRAKPTSKSDGTLDNDTSGEGK